jgi:hypothetical protein
MAGILTTARLVCKSTEARKTAIKAFRKIIAYTTPNEPEVLQYVCTLPVDDTLGTEIYMIEEYVCTMLARERGLTCLKICEQSSKRRTSRYQARARPDTTLHYWRRTSRTAGSPQLSCPTQEELWPATSRVFRTSDCSSALDIYQN